MKQTTAHYVVALPGGFTPLQVDVPCNVPRSRDGSVHLRPNGTISVTAGELSCIKADTRTKNWINRIRVVRKVVPKPATKAAKKPAFAPSIVGPKKKKKAKPASPSDG